LHWTRVQEIERQMIPNKKKPVSPIGLLDSFPHIPLKNIVTPLKNLFIG
jgi:hypothetical protein